MKLSFQDAQNRSIAVFRVPGRNVVRWSSDLMDRELFCFLELKGAAHVFCLGGDMLAIWLHGCRLPYHVPQRPDPGFAPQ